MPELVFVPGEPWRHGARYRPAVLTVARPSGEAGWTCILGPPSEKFSCGHKRTWFRRVGTYTVTVTEAGHDDHPLGSQQFYVDGSELAVEIRLQYVADDQHRPMRLAELHVARLMPSVEGVWLEEAWTPAATAEAAYRVLNMSSVALYGVGTFGHHFGYTERRVGDSWVRVRRGGFCGTVGPGQPVPPKRDGFTTEGIFIGTVEPFTPGDYRYVLPYSTTAPAQRDADRRRAYSHVSQLHVVVAPFQIRAADAAPNFSLQPTAGRSLARG